MNIFIDNNDLEEQYGEQKYKEYLEEENKQMKQDITTMNNEIERLNNIIDRAIEYIRQLEFESEELYDISEIARLELLDILKGDDKE